MLNPEMINKEPVLVENEQIVLKRPSIELSLMSGGLEELKLPGIVILTTKRLLFVATKPKYFQKANITLSGFSTHYKDIFGEKFVQPIFGCNYLKFIANAITAKLFFLQGGASVFYPILKKALYVERNNKHTDDFIRQVKSTAVKDPKDPSIIYIS